MTSRPLLGLGSFLIPIPRWLWRRRVEAGVPAVRAALGFMTEDHHRVRDYAVTELPRAEAPLAPETFAGALALPVVRVVSILEELERNLTFLFRDGAGAVTWAYPVTVEETPHRARFSTGEDAWSP